MGFPDFAVVAAVGLIHAAHGVKSVVIGEGGGVAAGVGVAGPLPRIRRIQDRVDLLEVPVTGS